MVALHQGGQRVQKRFWAIERIDMQLRLVIGALVIRVKHYGRNMKAVAFRADAAAFRYRHGISNHNSADVAGTKDCKRSFDRRNWYNSVSGMRQNGISDRSQHPLCGDRKD
jgi:hypothetical protein